jgi:hypothetical protein
LPRALAPRVSPLFSAPGAKASEPLKKKSQEFLSAGFGVSAFKVICSHASARQERALRVDGDAV